MKKILIYSNMYPSAIKQSAGVFVKNQYEYLKQHDKKNEYLILALERSFTGKIGSIKKYISFYKRSFLFNLKHKPGIIHLHYFFPLLPLVWMFKKIRGIKIIVTVHGSDLYVKMKNKTVKSFYRYLLKSCDHIICVGNKLKQEFEQTLKVPVSEVLSAGVDENIFHPLQQDKEFDFIYVGSLIDRKGFDIVLKLIETTAAKGYKWCIVGSGKYQEALNNIIVKLPGVCTYVKSVNQVQLNILYNKARWLFFPSRIEPFGLVASEAVFAGIPILCSLNGGLSEQLIEGVNGFAISDINNYNDMIMLLDKAHNLKIAEYRELVNNCLTSNYKFSLKCVCNRLIDLYETI